MLFSSTVRLGVLILFEGYSLVVVIESPRNFAGREIQVEPRGRSAEGRRIRDGHDRAQSRTWKGREPGYRESFPVSQSAPKRRFIYCLMYGSPRSLSGTPNSFEPSNSWCSVKFILFAANAIILKFKM